MTLTKRKSKYFEHKSCKCKKSYKTLQYALKNLLECRDKKGCIYYEYNYASNRYNRIYIFTMDELKCIK